YSLRGDPLTWENEKQGHGQALLELWRQYAPNLNDSNVLDCFVLTPLDTEQTLPNMVMGDLLVGSFAGNQIGYNRPFAGAWTVDRKSTRLNSSHTVIAYARF